VKWLLLILISAWVQISFSQQKLTETKKGRALKEFYLSLQVESHWIAGQHVNWETGDPDNADAEQGIHTHCSAFVAAACKKLNIYILRPPEHAIQLLANAQYDWLLTSDATQKGWKGIRTGDIYLKAQELADSGFVVIAICRGKNSALPGHVAFVRPAELAIEKLSDDGPMLIMAGRIPFSNSHLNESYEIKNKTDQIIFHENVIFNYHFYVRYFGY
jgi:hypothetical protein